MIWGFVYGAAAMAGTGLALAGLTGVLSVTWWGIVVGLVGLALVWTGRYSTFEKVLAALVGLMFVTMVGAALLTVPNIPELLTGLARRAGPLLYSTSVAIESGDAGLLDLGVVLQDRYGEWAGKVFLIGFWAAAMSSLVGVWNGVSLMFADFMTNVRGGTSEDADARAGGKWYRLYILWLTFPPMAMLFSASRCG